MKHIFNLAYPLLSFLLLFSCNSPQNQIKESATKTPENTTNPNKSPTITTVTYEHVFKDDRPFAQCHASTMIGLNNGQYLLAWFAGSHEKNDDVGIWMASGQPGKWSAPYLAVK